jgi:hypothetical protein
MTRRRSIVLLAGAVLLLSVVSLVARRPLRRAARSLAARAACSGELAELPDAGVPSCLVGTHPTGIEPGELLRRQAQVARDFAPVFVQRLNPERRDTKSGEAFEDYFLRFNYDGNWNGFDNDANLARADERGFDLRAYVYYGVQESERHYFLHYAYYHARDPKRLGGHPNDFEGALVVVRKAPRFEEQARGQHLVVVQAQAHNVFGYERGPRVCLASLSDDGVDTGGCTRDTRDARTHPVLASQVGYGRNIFSFRVGHGTEIPHDDRDVVRARGEPGAALVYVPADEAEAPDEDDPVRPIGYRLLSLTGDRDGDGEPDTPSDGTAELNHLGLWDRREDDRIYAQHAAFTVVDANGVATRSELGHGLFGDAGCKANLPWGWSGDAVFTAPGRGFSVIPSGAFFLDPAGLAQRETMVRLRYEGVVEPPKVRYVANVFLRDRRSPMTVPQPAARFQCSCEQMQRNVLDAGARGLDSLGFGERCAGSPQRVEARAGPSPTPPAERRAALATRWDTCEELLQWVAPEDRDRVQTSGSGAACVLLMKPAFAVPLLRPNDRGTVPLASVTSSVVIDPGSHAGLQVRARRVGGTLDQLGGLWLHDGVSYHERLSDVPFFRPQPLPDGRWIEVVLDLADSPQFLPSSAVGFVSLGPVRPRLADADAVARTLAEGHEDSSLEVDWIRLVANTPAARRTARMASALTAPPELAIREVQPRGGRPGSEIVIEGSGFDTECGLNTVLLGSVESPVVSCAADSLRVRAEGSGSQSVTVLSSGGRKASFPGPFSFLGVPERLEIVAGGGQSGWVGVTLQPFAVRVRDDRNDLPDERVSFRIVSGGGRLSAAEGVTDARGLAQTTLTLERSGPVSVEASVPGLDPVTFSATGSP